MPQKINACGGTKVILEIEKMIVKIANSMEGLVKKG